MERELIQANIKARNDAVAAIELLTEMSAGGNSVRFWELVAEHAATRIRAVITRGAEHPPTMTYEEAIAFGAVCMPFGAYAGALIRDVPVGYLATIADDLFNKQLRRYVGSVFFARLQEEGE